MILDRSLKAIALDHGARSILADCNGISELAPGEIPPIPRHLADLVGGRSWTSISGSCVTLAGESDVYHCTMFRVEPQGSAAEPPMLALHFQKGISPEDAINHIANSCGLTDRELEVLRGLSTGLTSKEIATQLEISPNTVKSYIRLIMVKIGVTTRSGIVGKLLEHAAAAH